MNTAVFLIFFLCSSLFFGLGLVAAGVAYMKGYRPWFWLVSLGPIGAMSMLLRPNLNRATTPEEREQWEQRADWTGGILSGITLFFAMGLPIVGMLAFFSLRTVAVPSAPAMIAVPALPIEDELVKMPVTEPQVSPVESSPEANSNQSSEPSVKPANEQPRVP
ncbi:MAG: hypothetical protein H7062_21825 [Candidatus Saccharimonas sp.]|nr:hypothetical protein [Planctomycetaceae bacterium]